nr:MAG TPA: hypothetical protein [Caudoviricetes sp.]
MRLIYKQHIYKSVNKSMQREYFKILSIKTA